MPNSVSCVIVPHSRFVEYQDRHRKKAVQPIESDGPSTSDDGVMSPTAPRRASEPPNEKQC